MKRAKKAVSSNLFFYIVFLSVLLGGIALRVIKLAELPPPIHPDEAFMAQSAIWILERSKNLLDSYFSVTIAGNILTSLFISLFDLNVYTLRLSSVIFGTITNIFLYLLLKDLYGKKVAFISFFLANFSHLPIAYSRINLPNIQAPFFLVSSLYFLNTALKKSKIWLFFLGGLIGGLSLYSYSGAKIILAIAIFFLAINFRRMSLKFLTSYLLGIFFVALPLLFYIQNPANNFVEREKDAFIINNPTYWRDAWQTDNLLVVFYKQIQTNFRSFLIQEDFSNQYGNGPLLDKLSSVLLILFILFFTRHLTRLNFFFISSFLIIISVISLTESPPLSQRLLVLYPFTSLFLSLSMYYSTLQYKNEILKKFFLITILTTIFFLNLKIYFYDYSKNNNAYYNWIEPNSSIAFYRLNNPDRKIFLLSNSHTYASQLIITTINYKRENIENILKEEEVDNLLARESSFTIIIPLVPEDAEIQTSKLKDYILEKTQSSNLIKTFHMGIPCRNCQRQPIFLTIEKN